MGESGVFGVGEMHAWRVGMDVMICVRRGAICSQHCCLSGC